MQNQSEILQLFPDLVYKTYLPNHLSSLIPWFDNQELYQDADADNYGYCSKNTYLFNEPECKELSDFILGEINKFGNELGYDYDRYRFTQSWLSIKYPGQHHTSHSHPNSLISGVFYYGDIQNETPQIEFLDAVLSVNTSRIAPRYKKGVDTSKVKINLEPGLLLLFPSYLHHGVSMNNTNSARTSVAFNSIPVEGFGDRYNLTELIL